MFKYQNRTVYRQKDGKWANRLNDAPYPSTLHATHKEAIAMAKRMLINSGGGELKVDMPGADAALMAHDRAAAPPANEESHALR
ncbi:DUF2188 domain-containing protein [Phytohalomonas tamaricis]|uniref:DUF2188 domain-containing protein n=1 Tax=Phytohalomonas tamaricis TaxID=2081032 RepID=UPI001319C676|nr:DUF2188 domain-containing protein [Phytohalomonas tamaricis]